MKLQSRVNLKVTNFNHNILQCLKDEIIIIKWLINFVYFQGHSSTKWVNSRETLYTGHSGNAVSTTHLRFGLWLRTANCVGSRICPCLKRACLGQDWLWLYFGETEQSGVLETGAWLQWRAGCPWQCSPEGGQSSAGTASTSKLSDTWTEPASGQWKKPDPLTTNTCKISLKERNTSLFYEG